MGKERRAKTTTDQYLGGGRGVRRGWRESGGWCRSDHAPATAPFVGPRKRCPVEFPSLAYVAHVPRGAPGMAKDREPRRMRKGPTRVRQASAKMKTRA